MEISEYEIIREYKEREIEWSIRIIKRRQWNREFEYYEIERNMVIFRWYWWITIKWKKYMWICKKIRKRLN